MSVATENNRISLLDNFQYRMFDKSMRTLRSNYHRLSEFDRRLFNDLDEGFKLVGRDMSVSRRQMNHITTTAAELESGRRG